MPPITDDAIVEIVRCLDRATLEKLDRLSRETRRHPYELAADILRHSLLDAAGTATVQPSAPPSTALH